MPWDWMWHYAWDTVHTLSGLMYMRCCTWLKRQLCLFSPPPVAPSNLSPHSRSRAWVTRSAGHSVTSWRSSLLEHLELDAEASNWWLAFDGLQTALIIKAELSSGKSNFSAGPFSPRGRHAFMLSNFCLQGVILVLRSISCLVKATLCHAVFVNGDCMVMQFREAATGGDGRKPPRQQRW